MTRFLTRYSFYPWLVMLLCASFLFYKYVLQVSPSLITSDLMAEFKIDGAGLGNLSACYFYAYFFTQLLVGVLLDKFSVRFLGALAILISGLGALGFAHTDSLWQAGLARALMGVGTAFATVCYLKSTALWFKPKHFAFVSGLLATAAMLGAVFGEAPVAMLIEKYNWHVTLAGMGYVGVALAALFYLLVSSQGPALGKKSNTKEIVNFKAVMNVLKSKQNWLLTFYSGLTLTPISVFGGLWGTPFLKTAFNLNTTDAATLISAAFLGLAVGGPVLGLLSDHFQNRKATMLAGNILALFCLVCVLYLPHLGFMSLMVLLFGFGFGIGAFMLCFALGKELNPLFLAATVIAMINSGDAIFGSFSEPLVGKVLDMSSHGLMLNHVPVFSAGDYRLALSLLTLYLVFASFTVFFMNDPAKTQSS